MSCMVVIFKYLMVAVIYFTSDLLTANMGHTYKWIKMEPEMARFKPVSSGQEAANLLFEPSHLGVSQYYL